jgi:hypothetical protein
MKRCLIAAILFVFLIAPVTTTAAISNVVVSGQNITISGDGFGAKVTAEPLFYSNFEECNTGDTVDVATSNYFQNKIGAIEKTVVGTDNQRTGSVKSLKAVSTDTANPLFFKNNVGFATTGKIFVSVWMRTQYPVWSGGTQYESTQIKTWRVASSILDNGAEVYPAAPLYLWTAADYSYHWAYMNQLYSVGQGSLAHNFANDTFVDGQWQNIMLIVDQGTAGSSDGSYYVLVSKNGSSYVHATNEGPNQMVIDSIGNLMDSIKFDSYLDANNADLIANGHTLSTTLYYDDIYIDNSWARVEIGDEPIYANCTHREIQPATAWADGEITITFNQGSFVADSTAYLFVIDSDGVASAGYEITIGEEPSANPIVEILTASGQTTTASVFEITGTATADTGLTISGASCPGQTVTADDGTWDELSESWTCQAALSVGVNNLTFTCTDSISNTGTDSVSVTRTETPTSHSLGKGFYSNGINFK